GRRPETGPAPRGARPPRAPCRRVARSTDRCRQSALTFIREHQRRPCQEHPGRLALPAKDVERALQVAAALRGPPVQLADAAPVEELRPLADDHVGQRGQPLLDCRSPPPAPEPRGLATDQLAEARPISDLPEQREGGSRVAGLLDEAGGGPLQLDELRRREPVPPARQQKFAEQGLVVVDGLALGLLAREIVLAVKT